MTEHPRLPGVFAPVLTPFKSDLSCDLELFVRFCRWLQRRGAGLAVFGTNSEANSLTVEERLELLAAVIAAGLPPASLLPGTGACAIGDSVRLGSAAANAQCAGVLMLPPFYYKQVSDEGVFAAYSEVIERVGDRQLRVFLYHIPQLSGVPISLALIERLITRYPQTVVGMKDSSGDFNNTKRAIQLFPGFKVYSGSDTLLLSTLRQGGAGCISATANVNPAAIVRLWRNWQGGSADGAQAELAQIRKIFEAYPMIAALKAAAAHHGRSPGFARVRPPLAMLSEPEVNDLIDRLAEQNFTMPNLQEDLAR
jgi:4-hydroxy-tetrahydrodipicolinate synthase